MSLEPYEGLLSISHGSVSSWDSACLGVLTVGMLSHLSLLLLLLVLQKPHLVQSAVQGQAMVPCPEFEI